MTYYIKTEEKQPKYLIWSIICSWWKHIGTNREHTNKNPDKQEELKELEFDLLNKNEEIIQDEKDDGRNDDLTSGESANSGENKDEHLPALVQREQEEDSDDEEEDDVEESNEGIQE
eukprot:807462-Ditylum_brightwellii.AAC.1